MLLKMDVLNTFCEGLFFCQAQAQLELSYISKSGLGSMQGKNTEKWNMDSAVCASSMNKSLEPTPI